MMPDTATITARVAAVPTAPQQVVRVIDASRLQDFFDMARIGMNSILAYRIQGEPPVAEQLACSLQAEALDAFAAQVSAQFLAPLAQAGVTGYLLQGRTSVGLMVPDAVGDLLLVCSKDFPQSEDCHCG